LTTFPRVLRTSSELLVPPRTSRIHETEIVQHSLHVWASKTPHSCIVMPSTRPKMIQQPFHVFCLSKPDNDSLYVFSAADSNSTTFPDMTFLPLCGLSSRVTYAFPATLCSETRKRHSLLHHAFRASQNDTTTFRCALLSENVPVSRLVFSAPDLNSYVLLNMTSRVFPSLHYQHALCTITNGNSGPQNSWLGHRKLCLTITCASREQIRKEVQHVLCV
jgi:hypothetical protein